MKVLLNVNPSEVVFLDIETARVVDELQENTPLCDAWRYRKDRYAQENGIDVFDNFKQEAALYPEYARILCITLGRISGDVMHLKSYADEDEKLLLEEFTKDLTQFTKARPNTILCGLAIKGFDIPFIFRRCLINQVFPHSLVDVAGMKPWEVRALDLKELWKGSATVGASLVEVCVALGIKSPKNDISGAEVGEVYWREGIDGLNRIIRYCEGDVVAVINVFRMCRFEPQLFETNVLFVEAAKPENMLERIMRTGIINHADTQDILKKAKELKYPEKEVLLTTLRAALAVTEKVLDGGLELKILSGQC